MCVRMQSVVVHSGWAGKTFALARCNDSGGKKPRSRRTKEERKTMVESFINKYRNLNNGKFPSLNLTHKEVGGSFYTVREIVREIIQQNRVLCPGNSTSQALNLEYCPDKLAGESFSMDISAPLSISMINYAVDQGHTENLLPNECRRTSTDIIEVDESVSQEYPESHPNHTFPSQVPNGERYREISTGAYLNGKLEGSSSNEPNLGKLFDVEDENLGVSEQTYYEVQVHSSENPGKVEHSVPSCEAVSMTPPLFESVVIGDDNGDTNNVITEEINSSVASSSPTLSDCLSEANGLLDPIPTCTSPCDGEDPPVSALVETCNAGKSQKIIGMTASLEVPKTSGSDEVKVASVAFEKDSLINKSETTEILSSIGVDEGSAASPSRQLSTEKDFVLHKSETIEAISSAAVDEVSNESLNQSVSHNLDSPVLGIRRPVVSFNSTETQSSIAGDEVSNESLNGSALLNLDCPALESGRPVVHTLFKRNDFEKDVTNIECAPGESIRPSFKGRTYSEVKPLHEYSLSNIGSVKDSGSISQNEVRKESEKSEINPVWTTIKSLLKAVVKFWTE